VVLRQWVRRVLGRGQLERNPCDLFAFQGVIRRTVYYGAYRRTDSHVRAGTGTFVLKIEADSRTMVGHCLWFDSGLDTVWRSEYRWERGMAVGTPFK